MKHCFSLSLVLFTIGLLGEATPLSAELCAIDYEGGGAYVPAGPPQNLVPIDLDNDGDTDLATVTSISRLLVHLFNGGDGRFLDLERAETRHDFRGLRGGDFDGDGRPDLLGYTGESIVLFHNTGTHGFVERSEVGALLLSSVVTGDLDNDGDLDLVGGGGQITVLLNNGPGSFFVDDVYPFTTFDGIVLTDLHGDGALDLAISRRHTRRIDVLPGNGRGGFEAAGPSILTLKNSRGLAALDLDADGSVDLISEGSIAFNTGSGAFPEDRIQPYSSGPFFESLVDAADFDGDGLADVLLAADCCVGVLANLGDRRFAEPVVSATAGTASIDVVVADLNGDGAPDAATSNSGTHDVSALLNDGTGRLTVSGATFVDSPTKARSVDLDGDGRDALVVISERTSTVTVLVAGPDGTLREDAAYAVEEMPADFAIGDMNRDGSLDVVVSTFRGEGVSVLLNRGDGTFETLHSSSLAAGTGRLALGDVDLDGDLDVVAVTAAEGEVLFLLNDGAGRLTLGGGLEGGESHKVVAMDANHDGAVDLITGIGSSAIVHLNNGVGDFSEFKTISSSRILTSIVPADFGGDNNADLALVFFSLVQLYAGDGKGGFALHDSVFVDATDAIFADLNGNGKTDLLLSAESAVLDPKEGLIVLLDRGDGTFGHQRPFHAVGERGFAFSGDFDGDGTVEVGVVSEDASVALVLRRYEGRRRADRIPFGCEPECSTETGGSADCDLDGIRDDCAVAFDVAPDCNRNDVPDACDVREGTSADADFDLVPDECQLGLQLPGDCDQSGDIDVADAVCLLSVLFLGIPPRLPCEDRFPGGDGDVRLLDWQGDLLVDISDAVALVQHEFLGAPAHQIHEESSRTIGSCVFLIECPSSPSCR
jgi:hypothetical protein